MILPNKAMSFLKRYFSKTMEKNQSMPNTEKDVPAMIPSDSNVDLLPQKEPQETLVVAKSEHLESPVQPPVPKEETKTEEQQKKPAIIILLTIRKINKELPDSYCIKKVRERIRAFRIPFPTVGVPFQCSFDFSKIEGIALTGEKEIEAHKPELHFQALPPDMGLSLHCDDHILTLSGTPKKEYDGKLYFVYQTEEQKSILRCLKLEGKKYEGYHNYQESIPFLIAGDPRNAWQDYDVDWDKEGCYKNEDKCSEGKLLSTSCGDIEVIAASVRGRSHANVAKPRDDAFHFDFDKETGWNFVAVADGLGSKKYSRKGSELACKTIVEALRKLLTTKYNAECLNEEGESLRRWKEHAANPDSEDIKASQLDAVFHNAVHSAWMAINNEAENKGAKIDDYSTTLLCAAFRYLKELKIWLIVSYWIGDGGAAIIKSSVANSSEDGIAVLGKPDGGEFA